jgi:formylglycine-generating enzyme required for sulfatase activity
MTLWTMVNRLESGVDGEQIAVSHRDGRRYYDVWHGVELVPRIDGDRSVLSFAFEPRGFAAVLALDVGSEVDGLDTFLAAARERAKTPLQSLSTSRHSLPQHCVEIAPTAPATAAPEGMVTIDGGDFDFIVGGVEIEGNHWDGVDVQYPWEDSPRRNHRRRMHLAPFHIDRHPVTNAQFRAFLEDSGWRPRDSHNFLRHWQDDAPPAGWENKPVTWVALEDARAYAEWAGKRLPHEWEWQYAAQGGDGRRYPWGDDWRDDAVPAPHHGRTLPPPADVDAHPAGASPFGVMDLVGNVWQWTDEYVDAHTRAAVLRGGSRYRPQTSHWYFPQAYRLDQHGKYLLMAPCKDRSGCVGFRCVVDAA